MIMVMVGFVASCDFGLSPHLLAHGPVFTVSLFFFFFFL